MFIKSIEKCSKDSTAILQGFLHETLPQFILRILPEYYLFICLQFLVELKNMGIFGTGCRKSMSQAVMKIQDDGFWFVEIQRNLCNMSIFETVSSNRHPSHSSHLINLSLLTPHFSLFYHFSLLSLLTNPSSLLTLHSALFTSHCRYFLPNDHSTLVTSNFSLLTAHPCLLYISRFLFINYHS